MDLRIVCLSGKAGSGKDFIYDNVLKELGYYRWALADHFKIWAAGRGDASFEDVFIHKPESVRDLLQQLGTEQGRMVYGEDVWCRTTLAWMRHLNRTWGISKFCITDVRFPNEVNYFREQGAKVIRINAPNRVANSPLNESARLHISETALDDYPLENYDGVVNNDPEEADTVDRQIHELLGIYRMPEMLFGTITDFIIDEAELITEIPARTYKVAIKKPASRIRQLYDKLFN